MDSGDKRCSGWQERAILRLTQSEGEKDVGLMTELLERAIAEASKLPKPEQDLVAALILEEIASERRWDDLFAKSQDTLASMAEHALAEHRAGLTEPLEPDLL